MPQGVLYARGEIFRAAVIGLHDKDYMAEALKEAKTALDRGEIPVGAVLVVDGTIVARAGNEKEQRGDPTAHAEMLVIQRGTAACGTWRLTGATLYVTLEPCPMCAGAMVQARLGRLVYGAHDPKAGAAGSVLDIVDIPWLNHRIPVKAGVLKEECGEILTRFFQTKRTEI